MPIPPLLGYTLTTTQISQANYHLKAAKTKPAWYNRAAERGLATLEAIPLVGIAIASVDKMIASKQRFEASKAEKAMSTTLTILRESAEDSHLSSEQIAAKVSEFKKRYRSCKNLTEVESLIKGQGRDEKLLVAILKQIIGDLKPPLISEQRAEKMDTVFENHTDDDARFTGLETIMSKMTPTKDHLLREALRFLHDYAIHKATSDRLADYPALARDWAPVLFPKSTTDQTKIATLLIEKADQLSPSKFSATRQQNAVLALTKLLTLLEINRSENKGRAPAGIFRQQASGNDTNKAIQLYEQGDLTRLEGFLEEKKNDPHLVGNVLRRIVKTLDPPLIARNDFEDLKTQFSNLQELTRLALVQSTIGKQSASYQKILKDLFRYANNASTKNPYTFENPDEPTTQITAGALAPLLAPLIYQGDLVIDAESAAVTQYMIEHAADLNSP